MNYVVGKMYLCRKINLDFTEIKKQILSGTWSRDLYLQLSSRRHSNEEEFLDDLADMKGSNLSGKPLNEQQWRMREGDEKTRGTVEIAKATTFERKLMTPNYQSSTLKKDERCYNCGVLGHLSRDCPIERNVLNCYKCKKPGHISRNCPESLKVSETKREVRTTEVVNTKPTLKDVIINHKYSMVGYIDNGSFDCIIRYTVSKESNFLIRDPIPKGDVILEVGGPQKILGIVDLEFEIDGVLGLPVPTLVVADGVIPMSLMIGRSWINQPGIRTISEEGRMWFWRTSNLLKNYPQKQ